MRRLIIGSVTAQLTPDEASTTIDDRQELVKTTTYASGSFAPAVCVVDGGYCADGNIDNYTGVKFKLSDWATIKGYATGRTPVSVTGLDGVVAANCRVVIKQYAQQKRFDTVTASIDIWRV